MKIVIDISKDRYDEIMSMDWKNCRLIFDEELRAIHDGKALEQEPCGDCISREAVMHILDEVGGDFDSPREAVVPIDYIADMVSELPSVTAQPKIGRWIYTGDHLTDGMLKCSECGFEHDVSERFLYCPNCGAKMSAIPTGQIVANGELYPGEFDDPLTEEGDDKE